jgi:hypothetical protein
MRLEDTNGALRESADRLFALIEQVAGSRPQWLDNGYYKAQIDGTGFVYLRLIGAGARTYPAHSIHLHTGWHEQLAGEMVTQKNNWHGNTPSADLTARADQPTEVALAEGFIRSALRVHGPRAEPGATEDRPRE